MRKVQSTFLSGPDIKLLDVEMDTATKSVHEGLLRFVGNDGRLLCGS